MSNRDDFDEAMGILASMFLLAVGGGIYLVLKAFGCFQNGDHVVKKDVREAYKNGEFTLDELKENQQKVEDVCEKCGTVNPVRCMYNDGCFKRTKDRKGMCCVCDGTPDAREGWWCNLCH